MTTEEVQDDRGRDCHSLLCKAPATDTKTGRRNDIVEENGDF
ncbi:MAG: hypothetical protein ABIE74_05680 [Pseudomonadota bacterium]